MEISRATEQDIQVIKQNLLYDAGRPESNQPLTEERMEQLMNASLASGAYYLMLREADEIKGWIMLGAGRKDFFTEELYGFIYELYVYDAERGKGYGKALLDAASEDLRAQGMKEVRLNVFEGNPAMHLYEKVGYQSYSRLMRMPLED